MTLLKLKYINEYVDRTGKVRRYFRRHGKQNGAIPGLPGSAEFMASYAAYLADMPGTAIKAPVLHEDSLAMLIIDYYGDRMFSDRKPSTRQLYRYALEPISKAHGHRSVISMTMENAEKIINEIGAKRPGMGNLTRAVMRRLFAFAVKRKRRKDNPMLGIDPFAVGEHHTWTDTELRQYEKHWRLGTRERLAYALLFHTGQRVGDVAKMRRSEISDGYIRIEQEKTGAVVEMPMPAEVVAAMKAWGPKGLSLIGDPHGRPIATRTVSALIRRAVKQAGLPSRCVAHGLRKARMRVLAENGATVNEIAAISGHQTLKEVERYTKAADRRKLARSAVRKVHNGSGESA
jgi:integrase